MKFQFRVEEIRQSWRKVEIFENFIFESKKYGEFLKRQKFRNKIIWEKHK